MRTGSLQVCASGMCSAASECDDGLGSLPPSTSGTSVLLLCEAKVAAVTLSDSTQNRREKKASLVPVLYESGNSRSYPKRFLLSHWPEVGRVAAPKGSWAVNIWY